MKKLISVSGTRFVTRDRTEFIPKGINMVCKDKSRNYIGDYTAKDFKFLKEKGFNLIRLGIFWDGVEPEPGIYDENYLDKVEAIINMASSENIPVFLDMHQDLYGIMFSDGAPVWATVTDGEEHIRTELWSESYLISPAVWHAFDNFWNNAAAPDGTGIRTHFIKMWQHLAERFAGHPGVVAYDVFNEPFPGSRGGEIACILGDFEKNAGSVTDISDMSALSGLISGIAAITGEFEQDTLCPFYDELFNAIRKVDPDTILLLESNYFANAGIPSMIRPAVTPSGEVISGQAYAPHGYDILVDTDEYETGGTDRIDIIFGSLLEKIRSIGLPAFIGEWGCYRNAGDAQKAQARHIKGLLASAGIGNVYYEYPDLLKEDGIITVL